MRYLPAYSSRQSGFTLIEAVVSIGVFAVIIAGVIGVLTALTTVVKAHREKIILSALADTYLEIARNLPYRSVGTLNGNPNGVLPDATNPRIISIQSTTYRLYYEVTYIDDPADGTILAGTDPNPNDYKQVKMFVRNMTTNALTTFVTNISPKGLEGISSAGAIRIQVFDARGRSVPNAAVHIENRALIPAIILDRTADAAGTWIEVGLPTSVNGYHIVVTKAGYSTDQTYPITTANPNPIKPDATVVVGRVTDVSFSIDLLANLTIKTLTQRCAPLDGVGVNVTGAKLIGLTPTVLNFDQNFTSVAGQILLNNIEWDVYTPTLLPGQRLLLYGTAPIQSINVLPGTSSTFSFILGAASANSLRVIVKDATTNAPLEGAAVHLRKGGSVAQDYGPFLTGGSLWRQEDWTGGAGQVTFTDPTRYFADDGNVDTNSVPTGVRLKKISGRYVSSGVVESSSFDTGTAQSVYTSLSWEPTSQDPATTVKFQVAGSNDNRTWNYKGPDGTAGTYYTVPGSTISSTLTNSRYVRYKAYLATTDDRRTPVFTSLSVNYVSGCSTPGQVMFPNLTAGNNYDLDVTLAGYQRWVLTSFTITGNQTREVLMTP